MLERIRNWWNSLEDNKEDSAKREQLKDAKDIATAAGEPWVDIVHIDVNPYDVSEGSFELDWNDIFIARLMRAGYKGANDREMVEQWFKNLCEGVATGEYE